MREMYRQLYFYVLCALLFSCTGERNGDGLPICKIDLQKIGSLSEVFEEWHALPLETNDSVLLSNIDKLELIEGNLFIADRKNMAIYQFDKEGRFLRMLDRQGPGPEEYISISDFKVRDNSLYVLSSPTRVINQYDWEGRFMKSYKLNDFYHRFDFLNGDTLVLYSAYSNEQKYNFQLYDMQRKEIVASYAPFEKNQNYVLSGSPFADDYSQSKMVTLPFDYRIYKLDNGFSPIVRLDFNSPEKLPSGELSFEQFREEVLGKSVVAMIDHASMYPDNTLYILYTYKFKTHMSRVGLKDGQVSTWRSQKKGNERFPFCFAPPLGFYGDYLVSFMPAYGVLYFDEKFPSDKNESGKLNPDDNPVLFFHKLKVSK